MRLAQTYSYVLGFVGSLPWNITLGWNCWSNLQTYSCLHGKLVRSTQHYFVLPSPWLALCLTWNIHRDKTRVQMPVKMFPHLKLLCWLFMGFLMKFGVFLTIKTRFWQYYSCLKMRKSHFNDEFLVLLGPIISSYFACSNEEKKSNKATKGACSSPISMEISHLNENVEQFAIYKS